ncbi:MAG TPA: multifunctional CCA tRNA nucleotidyl transferase/2'3'-cyclic phosphodiesterase/2'nucleotidase/phosphatase [Burkholderiales bacterium]|jgi:tRNA nucleotidyltransferase (CCA-adding enzyme)
MKIYQVGGSVRDALLGRETVDRDYVVVGATPDALIARGYKPVGKDFPVFLHPQTHEEYALARTERKTAPGYQGFVFHTEPTVTLEEDLARRDFTINAMARDESGVVVDPYHGQADLKSRLLRHVGEAFAEDPVRILRGARFAARFGFAVAPETLALMRRMTADGEVDALVPERVWQEVSRGLMEADPVRMFAVLEDSGALKRALPELEPWVADAPNMRALAWAARQDAPLTVRYAACAAALGEAGVQKLSERIRVPADCRDLALIVARNADDFARAAALDAAGLAGLVQRCDGLRQPERFLLLVQVAQAYAEGARGEDYTEGTRRLRLALDAVRGINAGEIARTQPNPQAINAALQAARIAAIAAALGT